MNKDIVGLIILGFGIVCIVIMPALLLLSKHEIKTLLVITLKLLSFFIGAWIFFVTLRYFGFIFFVKFEFFLALLLSVILTVLSDSQARSELKTLPVKIVSFLGGLFALLFIVIFVYLAYWGVVSIAGMVLRDILNAAR